MVGRDSASGITQYTYDTYGRMISKTDTFGNEVTFTYDAYGRLKTIACGEVSVSYTYDVLDRISTVTDARGNTTTYTYDAMSHITGIDHANGMHTAYTYSVCGQVTEETVTDAEGKTVLQYCYTHGLNGEILTITETEGGIVTKIAYTYDKEMRLIGDSVITEYTYDYQGTRSSKCVNAAETRYVTYTMSGLSYVLHETGILTPQTSPQTISLQPLQFVPAVCRSN